MTATATPTKDEILALERTYWDAMKAKNGTQTAKLSGDPSIVTGVGGVMTIPKEKMSQMTEEGDWTLESYEFEKVQFAAPTLDVAIIAYEVRQRVTMKGEPKELHAADSSTWIRGDDGWTCHAHTESIIQDPPRN